jgi:hypothetical protein
MELVRTILIDIEDREEFDVPYVPEVQGHSEKEIFYHLKVMHDAGLIEAGDWSSEDAPHWVASSLTSAGHDFLDAARNDTIWAKAKSAILSSGGVLTLDALKIGLTLAVKNTVSGSGS